MTYLILIMKNESFGFHEGVCRYHMSSWADGHQPHRAQEFSNMKHAIARNVIQRPFGLLKICWKILASPRFYNITTQRRTINASCLLHNFIRTKIEEDPREAEVDNLMLGENIEDDVDNVAIVDTANEWTQFRNDMAVDMFNTWQSSLF